MVQRSTTFENSYMKDWTRNGPEGSDTADAGLYLLDNSCLFDGSADYMSRTFGAGNRRTWTYSTWVKKCSNSSTQSILTGRENDNNRTTLYFDSTTNQLNFANYSTGYDWDLVTTQVFRDVSSWYHIVVAVDTTQATAANRIKIYVNGVQVTAFSTESYPSQNFEGHMNRAIVHWISNYSGSSYYYNGYLAETVFVDGTALTSDSFGELDANNNWNPIEYTGSYGTNGFRLDYADSGALGNDVSGNNNDYTTSGMTTANQVQDTPTDNYATWNPLEAPPYPSVFSEGNLRLDGNETNNSGEVSTMSMSSGKWYAEFLINAVTSNYPVIGIRETNQPNLTWQDGLVGYQSWSYGLNADDGVKINNNTQEAYGSALTATDVLMVAVDLDNGKIWWGNNGTWFASGDPAAGTNEAYSGLSGEYSFAHAGYSTSNITTNFGQRTFAHTPPTGFLALCTANLDEPAILDPAAQFDVALFEGTGAELAVTSLDFSPDMVWGKNRDSVRDHRLADTVRGATEETYPSSSTAEQTDAQGLKSFDANGFTLGTSNWNNSGDSQVAWCWKEGALPGFDIVSYTGNGANRTINHSLGVVPEMMIVKNRTTAGTGWLVWNKTIAALNAANVLFLQTTNAATVSGTNYNSTSPTSSVFSIGTNQSTNENTSNFIAYLFASVEGFSKVGSYEGNANADGPFVWCGFRPKFFLVKKSSGVNSWYIWDAERSQYNVLALTLTANDSSADGDRSAVPIDFVSNGIKIRSSTDAWNSSGATYIFLAFAEAPFKTARAR